MSRSGSIRTLGSLFRDVQYPLVDPRELSIRQAATPFTDVEETPFDSENQPERTPTDPYEAARQLGLYRPPMTEIHSARWRINGFQAVILIWTETEWANLSERPQDAQYYPCGVWCALRMTPN